MISIEITIFVILFVWLSWLTNNVERLKKRKNKCDCMKDNEVDIWRTKDDKLGLK